MGQKNSRQPKAVRKDDGHKLSADPNGGQSIMPMPDDNPPSMVDLDAFLAQVSARLATVGSVTLTRPQPVAADPGERMRAIIFALGDVHYALDARYVNEVVRQPEITPVPGLPAWVLGVTNLHGEIMSVVDLAPFLELNLSASAHPAGMMLVAQAADLKIGLMVDRVESIYSFPIERVISPPFKVEPGLVGYLRGAVDRDNHLIRLLECERLLRGPKMQQFS